MVNKKTFFSIIMPVYNAEKYLSDSVNSILNQSFTDFELILVDDCSTDNSPTLCDELATRDKRIKVIHSKSNNGPGGSRNIGLGAACGEYIMYFDSDDTIEPDTLEILSNSCLDSDITIFGININYENENGKIINTVVSSCENFFASNKEKIGEAFVLLTNAKIFQYACNKVYHRDFIKNSAISYEDMRLTEDFFYNIQLFEKATCVKCISNALYNYRKPVTQTLSNSYSPIFFELSKRKFQMEKSFLNNMGIANAKNLNLVYFNHVKHTISAFVRNESKKANLKVTQKRKFIKDTLTDETLIEIFKNYKPCTITEKVLFYFLKTKSAFMCRLLAKAIAFLQKNSL